MKKLLVLTLLLLPVQTLVPTQMQTASGIAFTDGMPNGRFWSRRTHDEKRMWLFGYSDGIKAAAGLVRAAERANTPLQYAILDLQPADTLTPTEIVPGWIISIGTRPRMRPFPWAQPCTMSTVKQAVPHRQNEMR